MILGILEIACPFVAFALIVIGVRINNDRGIGLYVIATGITVALVWACLLAYDYLVRI